MSNSLRNQTYTILFPFFKKLLFVLYRRILRLHLNIPNMPSCIRNPNNCQFLEKPRKAYEVLLKSGLTKKEKKIWGGGGNIIKLDSYK